MQFMFFGQVPFGIVQSTRCPKPQAIMSVHVAVPVYVAPSHWAQHTLLPCMHCDPSSQPSPTLPPPHPGVWAKHVSWLGIA
jgi:hypothetical protein